MKTSGESGKGKVKKDDPEQSRRFVETAKEIDAEKTGKDFEKAFSKPSKSQQTKK